MTQAGQPPIDALKAEYLRAARGPGSKKSHLIDALLHSIERGYWRPGDRLPTERQMADVLPVSLGTVQSAYGRLADAGVVRRKAGVGTHVLNLSEREGDRWFLRFLEREGGEFLPTDVRSARVEEIAHRGPWSELIGDLPSYIRIHRLISIAGRLNVAAEVYLDGGQFRPLLDFDNSVIRQLHIRQILHDRFNAPTLSRRTRIRTVRFDAAQAAEMAIAEGSAGLSLEAASFSVRERPLCFQRFLIPENPFLLDVKGD